VRTFAKVFCSIWADNDFRAISPAGQWLYFQSLTSPSLTNVGVADWRPKRIAALAGGASVEFVETAGAELCAARFAVIDDDTEEILLRSFIKHDGLMSMPNMALNMVKAHAAVASGTLRAVVVHELQRLRVDQSDLTAWAHKDSKAQLEELLERDAVDARTLDPWVPSWLPTWSAENAAAVATVNPSPKGSGKGSTKGSGNPSVDPSVRGSVDPSGSVPRNPSENPSGNPSLTPYPYPAPTPSALQPSEIADAISAPTSGARRQKARPSDSEARALAAQDPETTKANVLIAGWIDSLDFRPPSSVLGQVSKHVKQLLVEGFPERVVTDALSEWQMKGVHPSALPSIAHTVRSGAGQQAARGGGQAPPPGSGVWDLPPTRAERRPA
jgi:hypothetical protein